MLFDPRAHEPLLDTAWRPAEAEAAIRAIARDADDALRGQDWWPVHPLDAEDGDPDVFHGVYLGAAGVMWALHRLARAGLHEPRPRLRAARPGRAGATWRGPSSAARCPSLWMGEGGIALVAWLLAPTPALADRLAEVVAVDPDDDTLELMWGSPGLLLIADVMLERTGEARWAAAWSAIAEHLMARLGRARRRTSGPSASTGRPGAPRTRARHGRGRPRARAPPGAAPARPARPRRHRGARGHRGPRRRAGELAARARRAARGTATDDPHAVVPRRARAS